MFAGDKQSALNMKNLLSVLFPLLCLHIACFGQQADLIISQINRNQQAIVALSYDVSRTDTLGTYVRHMKGSAFLERNDADTLLGFNLKAKEIGDPVAKMYDGHIGYTIDAAAKNYEITTSLVGLQHLLDGNGGHMVVPDLMSLKTTDSVFVTEDKTTYLLMFKYPNIDRYNISNKFKAIRINKETMLPVSVREHQESLGRIQDLYYEITRLVVNPGQINSDLVEPDFLKTYKHIVPVRKPSPIMRLLGAALPDLKLQTFINGKDWVSNASMSGKVVLLDFWEVWCGPCVESMPKIEAIHEKYGSKGLLVYGIVNDPANVAASKTMAKVRKFTLPVLLGSERLRDQLKITGIPLYILIDKTGKVSYIGQGFSNDIETAVIRALEG